MRAAISLIVTTVVLCAGSTSSNPLEAAKRELRDHHQRQLFEIARARGLQEIQTLSDGTTCAQPKWDPTGVFPASSSLSPGSDLHHVWLEVTYTSVVGASPLDAMITSPQASMFAQSIPIPQFNCVGGRSDEGLCEVTCRKEVNIQTVINSHPELRTTIKTVHRDDGSVETGVDLTFTFQVTVPSGIAIIPDSQLIRTTTSRFFALSSGIEFVVSGGATAALIGGFINTQEFKPSFTDSPDTARLEIQITLMTGTTYTVNSVAVAPETDALDATVQSMLDTRTTATAKYVNVVLKLPPTINLSDSEAMCSFSPVTLALEVVITNSDGSGSRDTHRVEVQLKKGHTYAEKECVLTSHITNVTPKLEAFPASLEVASVPQPLSFTLTAEALVGGEKSLVRLKVGSLSILFHAGTSDPMTALGDAAALRNDDGTLTDLAAAFDYTESFSFSELAYSHTGSIILTNDRLIRSNLIPAPANLGSIQVWLIAGVDVILVEAGDTGSEPRRLKRVYHFRRLESTVEGVHPQRVATVTKVEPLPEPVAAVPTPGPVPVVSAVPVPTSVVVQSTPVSQPTTSGGGGLGVGGTIGVFVAGIVGVGLISVGAIAFDREYRGARQAAGAPVVQQNPAHQQYAPAMAAMTAPVAAAAPAAAPLVSRPPPPPQAHASAGAGSGAAGGNTRAITVAEAPKAGEQRSGSTTKAKVAPATPSEQSQDMDADSS